MTGASPRFDPKRRRAVVFALLLVTALASFESTVVSTAMPTIIGDLHGLTLYSWVFSVYLLTSTISMPLFGRLADLWGRRRVLLASMALFLAGALVCALARSMPQLIAARALQGLGAGGVMPVALTVTGDLFSIEERAKVQGLFSAVWGVASLAGPLLGAFLTVSFGWRSIFAINLPLGLVAFALVATKMVESRERRRDPLDLAGAVTLAAGVTAILFAVLHRAGPGSPGLAARAGLLLGGLALLALFERLQGRREHPLIPPSLFTRGETLAPYLSGLLIGTSIYGVDTFVPLFVQGARGGSAGAAGAVVTPLVFGWSLSAAVAARVIVRLGFRRTSRHGALVILAGFAGLVLAASLDAGVGWISLACGLVGLGLGPSSLSQVLVVQHVVPEETRGVATSLVPFSRTIGGSLGVGALGGVLAAGLDRRLGAAADQAGHLLEGGAATSPELRHAIGTSLLPVFVLLLLLAGLNVLVTGRYREGAVSTGRRPS